MTKDAKRKYHHGNLRQVLLEIILKKVEKEGAEGVSARAAAKEAGVAPAAVYRHFPDKRAFLTACAAEGFRQMSAAIDLRKDEAERTPMRQFRAVGEGYLAFAMERPNLFRLMFRGELIDLSDAELQAAAGLLNDLNQQGLGALGTPSSDMQLLSWAVVHGLATLAHDSQLDDILPKEPKARAEALMPLIRYMGPAFEAAGG